MYSMNLRVACYWLFGSEIILPPVPSISKSYINLNSRFLQTPHSDSRTRTMSASLPGNRELPASQYDLSTYWGRVMHSAAISDPRWGGICCVFPPKRCPHFLSQTLHHGRCEVCNSKCWRWNRTLLVNSAGLEHAKSLISSYKQGKIHEMTPELWNAKKIVDSTLHPGMWDSAKVLTGWKAHITRYWLSSFPSISNVMLRFIKLGSHSRNAYTRIGSKLFQKLYRDIPLLTAGRRQEHCYGKLQISLLTWLSTMPTPTNPHLSQPQKLHNLTFSQSELPALLHLVSMLLFQD